MKCYYSTHRFLFFFLFLIAPVLLKAQPKPLGIDIEDSWEVAKTKAAEQGKFVFVDFTNTYCGACKRMDREVFTNDSIKNIINLYFIFLHVDCGDSVSVEINKTLIDDIRPNVYPNMIFYRPAPVYVGNNGYKTAYIQSCNGFKSVAELFQLLQNTVINNSDLQVSVDIDILKNLHQEDKLPPPNIITKGGVTNPATSKTSTPAIPQTEKPPFSPPVPASIDNTKVAPPPAKKILTIEEEAFENLGAKLNSGNYTFDDLKNYAYMAKSFQKPYQEVADWYLVNTNNELSDENMQFIVDFANTTTANATKLMVDNIAKFKEKYGTKINIRISETLRNSVRNAPESEKKLVLDQALAIIDKAKLPDGNLLSFELKGMYYQGTKNWREYTKLCKKYIEQFEISEHVLLNNIATTYAENVDDPELLRQALLWAKKSVAIEPHYDNYQTCAILHIRLNDMDNANICKTQCLQLAATELDERIAKEIINDIVKKLDELISEQ